MSLIQAFGLGVLSAASPCLLPLYPGFLAYLVVRSPALSGRRGTGALGLAILGGVLVSLVVIGVLVTAVAIPLGSLLIVIVPLADLVLVSLGLALAAGRDPFARLAGASVPRIDHPLGQAVVYGMLLGPLALPCAGPFLIALLAISLSAVDALGRIAQFVAFGFGFGLPLVLLSALTAADRQRLVRAIVPRYHVVARLAGLVLIAVGGLDLIAHGPEIIDAIGG